MPTIDELPPAISVSDTDELAVLQSGALRSATRAQLLSGVQTAMAIPSGTLLGRMSGGVGAPEAIAIGANLSVGNGALNAPPPFVIEDLSVGGAPMPTDQVPIGQSGQNAAISYAAFMAGLPTIAGIDGSHITARATGTGVSRNLADYVSDAVTIESFGAIGDGVTDDTAAFVAALASGRPLRLDGRTYIVNGTLQFTDTNAVIGVAGSTVIRRHFLASSSAWLTVESASIWISGVQFDAGGLPGGDMPALSVTSACRTATFVGCSFSNAEGPASGSGLYIATLAGASHIVERCSFLNNVLHGLAVAGAGAISVCGCFATGNGGAGIRTEAGTGCLVRDGDFTQNNIGISVANWAIGAAPPSGGAACTLRGNTVNGNQAWGIAVSATSALVIENIAQGNGTTASGGGLLVRVGESRVGSNLVTGGRIGIDARGCRGSALAGNHITGTNTGLSAGGSQNMVILGNLFSGNTWGVLLSAIEPALSFQPTGPVTVANNWIGFTSSQGGGVYVMDAAQGIAIVQNDINGWGSALPNQALWMHTDAATLSGNRWNNQSRPTVQAGLVAGFEALVVPDIADEVLVTASPLPVASILTGHQADTLGQLVFVKVTNGGAGYTAAQIVISGGGNGASARAVIADGQIVWIMVTNPGSGYGGVGSAISVVITGDGNGAVANGYVGLPVLEGRALRLSCNCQIQLALSDTSPPQQSWTGYASTIPALGAVDLEGVAGAWRATAFPPVDYLTPSGDGGVIVQSVGATNLVLRPGHGGSLQIANASEIIGCTSSVGRGSPLGMVAAPPGSDFRNLNGGAGQTFWIKQANTDATGWVALG